MQGSRNVVHHQRWHLPAASEQLTTCLALQSFHWLKALRFVRKGLSRRFCTFRLVCTTINIPKTSDVLIQVSTTKEALHL